MSDELRYCRHKDQHTWWEYDARGIPLAKVCDLCVDVKLATYRPEVLTNPSYETDEPIEEDDWGGGLDKTYYNE